MLASLFVLAAAAATADPDSSDPTVDPGPAAVPGEPSPEADAPAPMAPLTPVEPPPASPPTLEPATPPPGPTPRDPTLLPGNLAPIAPDRPLDPDQDATMTLRYEVALRARYVSVPRGLMDVWFTDDDDLGWPTPGKDRPFLHGVSYCLEFTVQKKQTLGMFYLGFLHSMMEEGYFDDRESRQPYPFIDGEWLRPNGVVGAIVFGANGAHEAPIIRLSQTKGNFAMAFVVGGGLGIAGIVGSIDQWTFDRANGTPAYVRVPRGDLPDRQVDFRSPIWPVPDFILGFKFNFADHVVLRLEGGLHGGLFYGGSLGARF